MTVAEAHKEKGVPGSVKRGKFVVDLLGMKVIVCNHLDVVAAGISHVENNSRMAVYRRAIRVAK
jgi:hypothetical protein